MASSTFLSLPPEIRYRIYEFCFEDTEVTCRPASIIIEASRARKMRAPRPQAHNSVQQSQQQRNQHRDLAILQVCKQVRQESEPFFFRQALFHIDIMSRSPVVPTENIYRMRRFAGGAEVRQLLEIDTSSAQSSRRKKYSIIGPFEPERVQVHELNVTKSMTNSLIEFMIHDANQVTHQPMSFGSYLPDLSTCVF